MIQLLLNKTTPHFQLLPLSKPLQEAKSLIILKQCVDLNQTCIVILLVIGKEVIRI